MQLTIAPTSANRRPATAAANPSPICTTLKFCSSDIPGYRIRTLGFPGSYTLPTRPLKKALLEPGVFEAPAVEDAVDHHRDPVHSRIMAASQAILIDDRAGCVLLQ